MNTRRKVILSWSGGKDSLMALWKLAADYEVVALITNLNHEQDRVSIHGVRRHLIEAQAAALGLPIHFVHLPSKPSNAEYEALVAAALVPFQAEGIQQVVYGDLFLQEIRSYRDAYLKRIGWQGIYPLWAINTHSLIREVIDAGFMTLVTCVDTTQLDATFAGRTLDDAFLRDLPASCDPCGENGEFHTFVYDSPLFTQAVPISVVGTWLQDNRFCYCDLE